MTEQQREAFHQWLERERYPGDTEFHLGEYASNSTQHMWEAWQAALSHAEGREFKAEQDLISFLDDLYETAGPDSSALTGQKWVAAQRAIEGIRSHAEEEAPFAWHRGGRAHEMLFADDLDGAPIDLSDGWEPLFKHPASQVAHTPAAAWRQNGEPDPHGEVYNGPRAALPMGSLTDDQLANCVFMHGSTGGGGHSGIAWLTAAKERIRWLSRRLVEAESKAAPQVAVPEGWREEFDQFWDAQTQGKNMWTTLERLAALDAWQHALEWVAKQGEAPTAPSPTGVTGQEQCPTDGGTCGAGGQCEACPTAPAGEPDGNYVGDLVELPNVLAWADGVLGALKTENADHVLEDEARVAQAIWAAHTSDQPVSAPDGLLGTPRPMSTAPRDGTMVRLMVQFTENGVNDGFDSGPAWTIGANTYDDSGDDEWFIAGWNWQQDCFTAGEGEPLGWLPMLSAPAPDEREIAALALERHADNLIVMAERDGRNSDRESQQTWEEAAYFAKQEAKRLRAGKEGEPS